MGFSKNWDSFIHTYGPKIGIRISLLRHWIGVIYMIFLDSSAELLTWLKYFNDYFYEVRESEYCCRSGTFFGNQQSISTSKKGIAKFCRSNNLNRLLIIIIVIIGFSLVIDCSNRLKIDLAMQLQNL